VAEPRIISQHMPCAEQNPSLPGYRACYQNDERRPSRLQPNVSPSADTEPVRHGEVAQQCHGHCADLDQPFLVYAGELVLTQRQDDWLAALARAGGGQAVVEGPARPLVVWFRSAIATQPGRVRLEGARPVPKEAGPWWLAIAAVLLAADALALLLRRGIGLSQVPTDKTARLAMLLAAASVLSLAAAWPWVGRNADALVLRGNAAFAQGKCAEALAYYEQAEPYTRDPGLVAVNRAATLYCLQRYEEAARFYRAALEDAAGSRRLCALYGYGTALAQAARSSDPQIAKIWLDAAEEALATCLKELDLYPVQPGKPVPSRSDVEHNLQALEKLRARLSASKKPSPPGAGIGQKPNADRGPTAPADRPQGKHRAELPVPAAPASALQPRVEDLPPRGGRGALPLQLGQDPGPLDRSSADTALYATLERLRRLGLQTIQRPDARDW